MQVYYFVHCRTNGHAGWWYPEFVYARMAGFGLAAIAGRLSPVVSARLIILDVHDANFTAPALGCHKILR